MDREQYISDLMYEDEKLEYHEALALWYEYEKQMKEMEE